MSVRRYVVVDMLSKTILGGPWLWDGVVDWTPPMAGTLMLATDAAAGGYTVPPTPVDPVVQNAATLQQQIGNALANNIAYLAVGTPTAAQVAAQVRALTRQVTALIRLTSGLLDTTDGT